ncbi:ribosome maturation factor RimP [uncultured Acetobacterium sp.]|jgi:ribosome maturation factor RimP|uniref:ribosome maturation factor RimP n=1 Tax=uncultured Acetobacterium sp. TaxID=217139 RepID=UPI0025E5FF48|nr:ribosome maturation factor RimP [uncultured Acetobacterium sp.]
MKKVSKEFFLEELTTPVVEALGYELTDLTFEKRGKDWCLTLFIDSEHGISLDDCETVSRQISELLDEQDPIEQSYFLEVSSPGMDRPLKREKHFLSNLDKKIAVHLFAPLDGKKDIEGVLKSYQTDQLTLELESGELLTLENSKIAKANRLDELNFKALPSS